MRTKLMTLRAKTIGIISIATISIFVMLYFPLQRILLDSFIELEQQSVSRNVQRVLNQIANALEDLEMLAQDYAVWDDTYNYMQTLDPTYIDSNYVESTYLNNKVNVILLINTAGDIVYQGAYDFNTQVSIPVPAKLLTLRLSDRLLTPLNTGQTISAIMLLAENEPMIVVAQPILPSSGAGVLRGLMIMGRFLDAYEVARLAKTTQLDIAFTDITLPLHDATLQNVLETLRADGVASLVSPLDKETVAGYAIVNDIDERPALLLSITAEREIYKQGRKTLLYLSLAIIAASLFFGIVIWQLLGRFVISRLASLRAAVAHIGDLGGQGDFSQRVTIRGEDELAQLGKTVNKMLDSLEQYQKELLVQKQRFENLVAVARATVEQPDLHTTLKNALATARLLTHAERGSLFILDEVGTVTYNILAQEQMTTIERQEVINQVMNVGLAGWALRHRQSALVEDTEKDLRWFPLPNTPYTVRSALVIPIFSGNRKLGVLTLTHPEVNHFTQDDLEIMQAAVDQMALAIRNAQIYEDQRHLAERQTTLYETLRTIGTLLDPEAVIQVAVERIADMTKWPAVSILLPDKKTESLVLHAYAGVLPSPGPWQSSLNYGTLGRAFRNGETLYIDDIHTYPSSVTIHANTACQIIAPLRYGQRTLGVLNIEHPTIQSFRADDIVLAESLADAIALASENARIHSRIRQYAANLNMLYTLAQVASRSMELDAMLPKALAYILEFLGFDAGFIGLLDDEPVYLRLAATQNISAELAEELQKVLNKENVLEYVCTQPNPLLIEDLNKETPQLSKFRATVPQLLTVLRHSQAQAVISTPIVHQGQVLGHICMMSNQTREFSSDDQAIQVTLIQQLAAAITNTRLFQAITDERSRLQALIESSQDGIIFINADQVVALINAAAVKLLNLDTNQQWNNRTTLDFLNALRGYAPKAARILLKELRRVKRADEEAAGGEFEVPPRTIQWLDLPVMTQNGPLGRLVVLHDITEEYLLRRMREDLAGMLVHDLRNPLTNIATALKLLLEGVPSQTLPVEQQRLLGMADRATQRMLNLVNAILDINRMEEGQMPMEYEAINLSTLVDEVIQGQMPLLVNKTLKVENALPDDLPLVKADRGLLERVLQNLIGNAIKFAPKDGTVRITARQGTEKPTKIYVSISDNGPGISADIQRRLFDKFTTGRHSKRGTGIGLAFCKMVLKAHNEDIWLESTGEKGTTFTFTLSPFETTNN